MDLAELEPHDHISALFDNAKEVDEFEYCSTLLRIREIENHGWDNYMKVKATMSNRNAAAHPLR